MTINQLQQWIDVNNIRFDLGQRNAFYVEKVRNHSCPSKRELSPKHKRYHSPSNKKPQPTQSAKERYVSPVRS